MYAIEFQAKVKDGIIKIPRKYLKQLGQRVRVILLVEETHSIADDFIEQLLAHPVRIKGFRPLAREEIYAR